MSAFSARFRATLFTRNLCHKDYKSAFVIFVTLVKSSVTLLACDVFTIANEANP